MSEENARRVENCLGPVRDLKGFILMTDCRNQMPGLRSGSINSYNTAIPQHHHAIPFSGKGYRLGGDALELDREYQKLTIEEEEI